MRHLTATLSAGLLTEGTPQTFASLDGSVTLHIDRDNEDYYIEAEPEHDASWLCNAINQADDWGLEVIPEDECPAELREDGSIRIYLAEKVLAHVHSLQSTTPVRSTTCTPQQSDRFTVPAQRVGA